jgi:hypothetical protein
MASGTVCNVRRLIMGLDERLNRAAKLRCEGRKVKNILHSCGTRLAAGLIVICTAAACAGGSPAARFDAYAARAGLAIDDIAGAGFRHRTFVAPDLAAASSRRLHVYFDGDGSPFLQGRHIAADPTPRRPLTLDLMRQDSHHAVLLGRPCYHGLPEGCEPSLWTVGRYSEPVVASMAAATERLIGDGTYDRVVLIGYSGGGVLALLVADRLDQVDAVVSVAANLDLAAWTNRHGYTPLASSIDPARLELRPTLRQLHLIGAADENVPPDVLRSLIERAAPGEFRIVPGFDHGCCWVETWPRQLSEIDRWLADEVNAQR